VSPSSQHVSSHGSLIASLLSVLRQASTHRSSVSRCYSQFSVMVLIEKIDPSSIVRASHNTPQLVASLLHSVSITKVVLPTTCQSFPKATIFRLLRDGCSEVAIIHQEIIAILSNGTATASNTSDMASAISHHLPVMLQRKDKG